MGALVFNIFMVVAFGWAVFETFGWRQEVSLFPRLVASLGLLMVTSQLVIELRNRRRGAHQAAAAGTAEGDAEGDADASVRIGRRGAVWLFAGLSCVVLLGVPVGVPLFVALLARYGFDEGWALAIGLAAAAVFIILAVFGGVFGAMWADPLLLTLFSA